jgi:hypothetical protein
MILSGSLPEVHFTDLPPMTRPPTRRFAIATLLAILAAAIAVPYPARAECASRPQRKCCCEHGTKPLGDCVSRTCDCCQPALPQNLPTEPVSLQTDLAATSTIESVPHGGSEFASPLGTAHESDVAAIPHRILHCSWLI